MSTFNLKKETESWQLRNKIANTFCGERHYTVRGIITFVISWHEVEPDVDRLQNAILCANFSFPWADDVHPDSVGKSLILGDPNVKIDNWTTPEKSCWFSIRPRWDNLRKGQVYAYEKYLNKIAEECAKYKLPDVVEVRALIEVRSSTGYKV